MFIRETAYRPMADARIRKMNRHLDEGICHVFSDAPTLEKMASRVFDKFSPR
jgi:hypothetical protein